MKLLLTLVLLLPSIIYTQETDVESLKENIFGIPVDIYDGIYDGSSNYNCIYLEKNF